MSKVLEHQALDWSLLPRAALGVLALLCGNGFIVGINQVYDVDIDAVNKPFLPVAAGVPLPISGPLHCLLSTGTGMAFLGSAFSSCYFILDCSLTSTSTLIIQELGEQLVSSVPAWGAILPPELRL